MSTAVALPRPGAAASRLRFVTYELALWLALYPVYLAIRGLSIDSYGTALANARDLISVERSLSIFHEGAVQDALSVLHGPLSTYYMLGFAALSYALMPMAPPRLVPDAVTATGNHYFLDSAAGVAVVRSALAAIRLFNRKER